MNRLKFILLAACFSICILFTTYHVAQAQQPGLSVGMMAPDFDASNSENKRIKLSDEYKNGPVVLIFYRGGWCPYCNRHLQDLESHISDFETYNAKIIAVSVDKIDNSAMTVADQKLSFDVISNPEGNILEAYNLVYHVPDELAKTYKEIYNIDLVAASGRTDYMIAIPGAYVIDQTGTIVFADANDDYKTRTSPEKILEFLKTLN